MKDGTKFTMTPFLVLVLRAGRHRGTKPSYASRESKTITVRMTAAREHEGRSPSFGRASRPGLVLLPSVC